MRGRCAACRLRSVSISCRGVRGGYLHLGELQCRKDHRMSHHLDTPLAAQTGQLLIDDLYVFPGEGSTVFILDINSDVNGLHTEPGFHPEARYEIKVHRNGAAFEDLTYRVAFAEPDADGRQPLTLHSLTGDQARGEDGVGDLVLEARTGETATDGDGVRLWAGHVKDSFYIDLSLLAIVNGAVANGTALDLSACAPTRRRTASPAAPSGPSCSRSRTTTRSCPLAPPSASGPPPSSRPTPAAGGRSTGPVTR